MKATQSVSVWGLHLEVPATSPCPICHTVVHLGQPAYVHAGRGWFELVYVCPNPGCTRAFIAHFALTEDRTCKLSWMQPAEVDTGTLPDVAADVSPDFVAIYAEAEEARQRGLLQICGAGLRKAFEFLVKDYAKQTAGGDPEKMKEIERSFSGTVVDDFIEDERIRSMAKRALWLGNDETHYLRKWTDHDVSDLETLIRLVLHWMEMERLSRRYVSEMPEDDAR